MPPYLAIRTCYSVSELVYGVIERNGTSQLGNWKSVIEKVLWKLVEEEEEEEEGREGGETSLYQI